MICLGLDTTGAHCTVTAATPFRILATQSEPLGRGHAARLAPMVNEVLDRAHLSPSDIDRIAVCTGPGSFTGLRVALSFARGFALPRRLPVIGVSSLRVMAAEADPEGINTVIAIADVRRGELCWATYDNGREVTPPTTQAVPDAIKTIKRVRSVINAVVVGDGADILKTEIPTMNAMPISHVNGAVLAWLAIDLDAGAHPPVPLYSRGPDAKLPGGISPP